MDYSNIFCRTRYFWRLRSHPAFILSSLTAILKQKLVAPSGENICSSMVNSISLVVILASFLV